YLAEYEQFQSLWFSEWDKCVDNAGELDTSEKYCKLASDCIFGSAVTTARKGFLDDVVSIIVIRQKIQFGTYLETNYGESLPSSCNFVFEPPYQPGPYPHEPCPYDPYKSEHYQRNPYQRNPYHRKTYQRNTYQRNPYKRRN
ncbi:hypothetical protein AAVH_39991, partial [Aphelenchoides avenae]